MSLDNFALILDLLLLTCGATIGAAIWAIIWSLLK